MQIKTIHSFLVDAGKSQEEQPEIKGTNIAKTGKLFAMLKKIFDDAHAECIFDVAFKPENGAQYNKCRELIVNYVKSGKIDDGYALAERLQTVTTNRSGMGLFFLMKGSDGKNERIVLSRFPADTGILAEEGPSTLNIEYVERIFMKNAKAYKSAVYEGSSYPSDFWKGKVIDKQINGDLPISEYWITDFLSSDFTTTGDRGTRRLANALKSAINKSTSIDIKEELSAAAKLAKGFAGKVLSAKSFAEQLSLSDAAKDEFLAELKHGLVDERFRFSSQEFGKIVAYKSVELDNGALLSAQAHEFESVFSSKTDKGKTTFSTTGKIVDEKIRKAQ